MANSRTFNLSINGVDTAINSIGQLQQTVERLDQELSSASFGTDEFDRLQQEAKAARTALAQLQQQTQAVEKQADTVGKTAKKMGGDFDDAFSLGTLAAGDTGEALGKLQGGFGSVRGGLETVSKGFGTLKGAIASTGIGLLLLAFGALVTYFTKSQEGMNFLDKKTKALQAVFNLLTNKVIEVGKFLFEAFSNPKKSLSELVDLIQNNLLNRLKAFSVVLDGIIHADFGKVTDGVIQLGTGITNATAKARGLGAAMKGFAADASKAAAAAEKIATSNQAIARAETALGVKRAESRAQIEALKKLSDDATKSNQVRLAAAQSAAAIENGLVQAQLRLQDQKIANLKAEQKLRGNSTGEEAKEMAELRKQRAEVQQESLTLQTELQNKVNAINQEAKAKREADTATQQAANEKAATDRKALLEKQLADTQAATAVEFELRRKHQEHELELAKTGSQAQLQVQKNLKQLETDVALQAIDDKYAKAGEKEKVALAAQRAEVTAAGERAQTKVEKDFAAARTLRAAQDQKDLADVKVLGLKEGTKAYYAALLAQLNAEEKLALVQLADTKENEAKRTLIVADAAAKRKKLLGEAATPPAFNIGTNILKSIFGVKDEQIAEVKEALAQTFNFALGATMQLLASISQARQKALDAQLAQTQTILEAAKQASDELKAQLDESQSRIDDLEGKLLNAKGVERQKIIALLAQERLRNQQIAAEKQREDERQKRAENEKLALEKKKTAEQEKQTRIQQSLNALQAISAAIGATEAAVGSIKAISAAGAGGKFGFDNIAYILAATAAMAGAFIAVKSAVKGFAEGGYTGFGAGYADHTGYRVAGVVHEHEYVVPKWMVTSPKYQDTLAQLEAARTAGPGYAAGGYAQVAPSGAQGGVDLSVLLNMQAELVSLRQDTNAALARPASFVVEEYSRHVATTTQIRDYFVK